MRLTSGIGMTVLLTMILLSKRSEPVLLLMTAIQVKVFHELRRLSLTADKVHLEKKQIISDWILFGIFAQTMLNSIWFDNHRLLLCFMFYTEWFMLWVLAILNRGTSQLGSHLLHTSWIHISCLYTLIQPLVIHINISNGGIFWFLFPCSLVICNDTFAYFSGKYYGKRKLLNLSPSKTVEGFIGGFICTLIFGYCFSAFLSQFDLFIEAKDKDIYNHIQYHSIVMATYASLAAPFGGFFASALKRASQIKDFGSWIPGHGGMTDRVDCQLFMAVFTYVYYQCIAK